MIKLKQRNRRGNPGTPPELIDAIRFLKEKYPDEPANMIRNRLKRRLDGRRYSLPTERTVRNILARFGPLIAGELDNLWSLGVSSGHLIPLEANSDLLKIWKWCVIVGRKFTIREAKWAASLRNVVRFENLLFFASMYAIHERMCKENQPFDTSKLDAFLTFEHSETWICQSLVCLDKVPAIFNWDKPEEFYGNPWLDWIGDPGKSVEGLLNISPKHVQAISREADIIYALWLRRLGEGPRWHGLSDQVKNNISERLHNEVAAKERIIRRASASDKSFKELLEIERETVVAPSKELLKEVGIEDESKKSGNPKASGTSPT